LHDPLGPFLTLRLGQFRPAIVDVGAAAARATACACCFLASASRTGCGSTASTGTGSRSTPAVCAYLRGGSAPICSLDDAEAFQFSHVASPGAVIWDLHESD